MQSAQHSDGRQTEASRNFLAVPEESLLTMYETMSLGEIARQFGVSRFLVRKALATIGVESIRSSLGQLQTSPEQLTAWNALSDESLVTMYNSGASLARIANTYGISEWSVTKRLLNAGAVFRPSQSFKTPIEKVESFRALSKEALEKEYRSATIATLAERYQVSTDLVETRLHAEHIEMRSRGSQKLKQGISAWEGLLENNQANALFVGIFLTPKVNTMPIIAHDTLEDQKLYEKRRGAIMAEEVSMQQPMLLYGTPAQILAVLKAKIDLTTKELTEYQRALQTAQRSSDATVVRRQDPLSQDKYVMRELIILVGKNCDVSINNGRLRVTKRGGTVELSSAARLEQLVNSIYTKESTNL